MSFANDAHAAAQPDSALRSQECLNGFWDFLPVLTPEGGGHLAPGKFPSEGWIKGGIVVPGSWTRGGHLGDPDPQRPWNEWRIFDNYGYPREWEGTNTAWYRRTFQIDSLSKERRQILRLDGVLREAWIFINRKEAGRMIDGAMPGEFDVTPYLKKGENEIIVYITDYRRDANGKLLYPEPGDQMGGQKGIWQDVILMQRPAVYADDVTIRTSTRRNEIEVLVSIRNASGRDRTLKPEFTVLDRSTATLTFQGEPVRVKASETRVVTVKQAWSTYRPWSPQAPNLYEFETQLTEGGKVVDASRERFGFREVWVEGPHVMLNGSPIHCFGEWGHKGSFDSFRPEYIRQWYGMLKDCNMNYIRTHVFPHPKIVLDMADEMGILVSLESSWFFGSGFALDNPEIWTASHQHIRNIIRRDKNHPSIIFWSVGNEVRWSGNQSAIIKNMPGLRHLYEQLDPTRIAYHDGDSSLWDERTQHLLSRHYGLECSGEGWWDKKQPLHVGEVGKWHFAQPVDNTIFGDDRVFASNAETHRAIAIETAELAEQARTNEVTCFFPWNLSGLDNYRPWPEEHKFEVKDPSSAGLKILRTGPYSSEFAWWEPESKGYVPGASFEIMRHVFRPLALMVRERLGRVFDDDAVTHTVTVVNDTGGTKSGALRIGLRDGDESLWHYEEKVSIAHGRVLRKDFKVPMPRSADVRELKIVSTFGDAAVEFDRNERALEVTPAARRTARWDVGQVAVFGDGSMSNILKAHKVKIKRISDLSKADPDKTPVLLVEKNAIVAGSKQNASLSAFVSKGGRAVILEQSASPMPCVQIDTHQAERCHIRGGAGDVLKGFTAADFEFWGSDPYGIRDSNSWVVVNPYRKPETGNTRILLESGYGDFNNGGMLMSPLFETQVGEGLAIACQLRLTEKAQAHPSALALLERLMTYAANWKARPTAAVYAMDAETSASLKKLGVRIMDRLSKRGVVISSGKAVATDAALAGKLAEQAKAGATVVVCGLGKKGIEKLSKAIGKKIEAVNLGTQYQLIRAKDDALLEGIGNQETFWIEAMNYHGPDAKNRAMTDTLMQSAEGESLLESERESCWRELNTLGANSEWLRMPAVTYYLGNGPRESASGLLRLKYGKGALVLCQVPMTFDDNAKARIFWTELMRNMGAAFDKNLFEGECIAPGSHRSNGFSNKVRAIADPSPAVMAEILTMARPSEFRLQNMGMESGFPWKIVEGADGNIPADQMQESKEPAKEVVIFFEVNPARTRCERIVNGLPDPSLQTLLEFAGNGNVTLIVNGKEFQTVALGDAGRATVADIDLDENWNTVLVKWKPQGEKLGMHWKNRQAQPEVEFAFIP